MSDLASENQALKAQLAAAEAANIAHLETIQMAVDRNAALVTKLASARKALEDLRRLTQSHVEYWKQVSDYDEGHIAMVPSQFQHIANQLAEALRSLSDTGEQK